MTELEKNSQSMDGEKRRVIVALDSLGKEEALSLARELSGYAWGFKVNDLLITEGVGIITALRDYGGVFADPKLYDIPNTILNSCSALARAGADLITVHASAGVRGLEAARSGAGEAKILGVSVLTSFAPDECLAVYGRETSQTVLQLARLVALAKVWGLVCSPEEIAMLRGDAQTLNLNLVVPGVRPSWYGASDDQRRVATPQDAVRLGATYLVIGRPITASPDPLEALKRVSAEIM